ncbi:MULTISPECIES: aspartate/glutamate racemase family protein [unclassified Symbiopectobacterium]|uniref:aspartate/glutamate racemase family protein n=1 Tax=unclassified Symbiopectobacterium TaxID=2794573 RepID=UPI0022261CB9|nr:MULTISPECIES: aspartate/glutamate racemase family protein [unclassified Symbiopectobacterium]MCW2474615.1 aspartate/glutamate racemase family protein [Candidatus Symbiopectobacterium sp. NZEC151]MCW2487618.1 aspartate/glutamate racemase family protein [Candidatus Symbiopectobacterium sp. NZEC127]
MKTLGLIGGMSWESTVPYYRLINERVQQRLGGLHSAKLILHSVDFHDIEQLQAQGAWAQAALQLSKIAIGLGQAGAEAIVICTNTMHKVADDVESASQLPVVHIADATANSLKQHGMTRVGLLGTRYTMEQEFYRGRLQERHGIDVIIPQPDQRDEINRVIYDELCRGVLSDRSRQAFRLIIDKLAQQGAQGVILGCTEIPLLIQQSDTKIPLFDTSHLHAIAAADYALENN